MSRVQSVILWLACLAATLIILPMQLLQALFGSVKRSVNMAIAVDQTVNALFGGSPDETISARIHRNQWKKTERFVNWLFSDPNHCKDSYESEKTGAHLPGEYR